MGKIKIKRIYEEPSNDDGYRILVDRLWPRGLKKENARLDEWNKTIAPSAELRVWFSHKPERFKEFERKYKKELLNNIKELEKVVVIARKQNITLLYAAKDPNINHAVVLCKFLQTML